MTIRVSLLLGRRVTLRPYSAGFTDDELTRLRRWARDPGVLALSGGTVITMPAQRFREVFLAQLPRRNSEREQQFVILDEAGRLIGRTGLFALDNSRRTAELGIVIGERDCWGKGYGRDAVSVLVAFGFEQLGLERIVLYTFPENLRAQRAFAAAGFEPVRELQRFSFDRGTHDEIEMAVTRESLPAVPD